MNDLAVGRVRTVGPRERGIRISGAALGLLGVLIALAIWEIAPRIGLVSIDAVPPASECLIRLFELASKGNFWNSIGSTLTGWLSGLAAATIVGIPLGLVLGTFALVYHAFRVPVEFLRPIPSVALLPLFVILIGITPEMRFALVLFGATWPILVQTIYGVQEVDPVAKDTARSFGFNRTEVFMKVVLPSALPSAATGLRTSAAIALILAITAELVAGVNGLGKDILLAQSSGDNVTMYALIVVTGMLGWLVSRLFSAGEKRILQWHPSNREVSK